MFMGTAFFVVLYPISSTVAHFNIQTMTLKLGLEYRTMKLNFEATNTYRLVGKTYPV